MYKTLLAATVALALAVAASPVLAKGGSNAGNSTNQSGRSGRCVDVLANPTAFGNIAVANCHI